MVAFTLETNEKNKMKRKRIGKDPVSSFLVAADAVSLYPSIIHKEKILKNQKQKKKPEEQSF